MKQAATFQTLCWGAANWEGWRNGASRWVKWQVTPMGLMMMMTFMQSYLAWYSVITSICHIQIILWNKYKSGWIASVLHQKANCWNLINAVGNFLGKESKHSHLHCNKQVQILWVGTSPTSEEGCTFLGVRKEGEDEGSVLLKKIRNWGNLSYKWELSARGHPFLTYIIIFNLSVLANSHFKPS